MYAFEKCQLGFRHGAFYIQLELGSIVNIYKRYLLQQHPCLWLFVQIPLLIPVVVA